jgi:hypothetical protein
MVELSKKEKEVLDFFLEYVNIEIYSIEQQERDLGRLDYSLCSDDNEKQIITEKKVEKFKKRISKCNPIIAGYLNALTTSDPLNLDYDEKLELISRNFILTEYYELFEILVAEDISELERFKFDVFMETLGFKSKPIKDFIKGVCDVNSFFTYKSFLEIPQNNDLSYDKVVNKLNNAFFRLEAFMNGSVNQYNHFDFNTAFTELFYFTKKVENFTYDNCKLIGKYWELTDQIRVDYDKSTFNNHKAYNHKAFCNDCNVITTIAWDRLEEFNSFATPDEIEEQTKKKSISDVIKSSQSNKTIKEVVETLKIETQLEETNPYPRIFTTTKAFNKFKNLVEEFGKGNQDLANFSFVFHRMKKDNLIFKDLKQIEYIDFLSFFEINLDRLKPISQLGNNDLRESIYNRV